SDRDLEGRRRQLADQADSHARQTLQVRALHAVGEAPAEGAQLHPLRIGRKIRFEFQGSDSSYHYNGNYEGLVPMLQRRYHESDNDDIREEIERFMTPAKCPECNGRRLKPEALSVTVAGKPIDEVVKQQLLEAETFFRDIDLSAREEQIAGK